MTLHDKGKLKYYFSKLLFYVNDLLSEEILNFVIEAK
jgi:hypothetical protein